MRRSLTAIGAALLVGGAVAWVVKQRCAPAACPYSQRFFLDLPRPFLRRETLLALLAPAPGERVLEVGAGLGYYSLPVAQALGPNGVLTVLDVQPAMLDELMRRAGAVGIANVDAVPGDAQALPFPDATFDAAFLVATLGEISDKQRALRELRRVVRPGGRLVVGEGQPDPHHVRSSELRHAAEAAGFGLVERRGGRLGYLARFVNKGDGVLG
jgi:ubiquinone/menaquinone biosynthesis C-methylase UbiE